MVPRNRSLPATLLEQTYYRWKSKYGGLEVSEARRLKELEIENGRLNRTAR